MASQCDAVFEVANSGHIEFLTNVLYQLQLNISNFCAEDPRLAEWRPGVFVLTAEAARALTGTPTTRFTLHPADLSLARFQAWNLPLFQLILNFPRPPYGTAVQVFSVFHLIADPIDTAAGLIFKLQVSQRRLKRLQRKGLERQQLLQLTLLVNVFEEYGDLGSVEAFEKGSAASDELPRGFNLRDAADAADALAADRASNVWLIIAAICIFLTSIALSYAKIAKTDWDTRNPWHISIIEISFSMTLASIVPAVLFAAIVGAQSSAAPTYRILEAFKATRKEGKINDQQILECNVEANLSTGPVASWQYDRWPWISARQSEARMEAARRWFYRELLAVSPVTIVWFGATLLSSRVPPDGRMNCQTQYELVIGWIFLFNYLSGIALSTLLQAWERQLFWLTMTKDICATLAVILTILLTMVGGLNRQSCWASDDGNLLLLPDTTRLDLEDRIRREYPAIIFTSLALPLIICGLTAWLYRDGISVYLQLGVKLEDEGLLSRRRKVSPSQASTIETDQTLLRMPMEREKLGQVALRLAPLILVLAIVDSSDRGSGRVGPLFLFILNYALMFFSMWKLYSSHRARRESHRNARAELREALTSAQIPTQEIDDANRRIDVEAQCRDKQSQSLGWMRICGSLLWRVRSKNESGSGGSDDEDEKPKRPERDDTTGPEIIIPLCVNEGSDSLPRLIELEARNYPSDDLFFETLNNVVTKGRLSGWAGFLIWCGLRRVVGIHYVKV